MTRLGRRADDGSATLEAVILTPALIAVGLLIVAGGRVAVAHQRVDGAAASAARAASLTRTAAAAEQAAHAEATASLATDHVTCARMRLTVSGAFDAPLGVPAAVTVRLACTATLADLALPGLPGSKTVTSTASEPLDSWRGRP